MNQKPSGVSLFLISAPSGAGKTSLVTEVIRRLRYEYPIERIATHTSRAPRYGEIEGSDYHFISKEEFERKIAEDYFLDWSNRLGNYYGLPRSTVYESGDKKPRILIVDREGARNLAHLIPEAILIWISVPHIEILRKRLINRNSDAPESIERRLLQAKLEIEDEIRNPFFHFTILNDDFAQAADEFELIIRQKIGHSEKKSTNVKNHQIVD